jgi:predicted cupin superfamily sugar epimerase
MKDAQYWIDRLGLRKHPEGGYYRETYRSKETIAREQLPERFEGDRAFSTAILFLLPADEVSAFHRIKQDEVWHFYEGSALTLHVIDARDDYSSIKLGRDIEGGESMQAVVEAGCVFGAAVDDPGSFALVGCTVAPGFDFQDFEMPARRDLLVRYPQHWSIIERLTR